MISLMSYAQMRSSGVSVTSERMVRTSVQYRPPALAVSAASERTVRSVLRVHVRIWQYTSNRGHSWNVLL